MTPTTVAIGFSTIVVLYTLITFVIVERKLSKIDMQIYFLKEWNERHDKVSPLQMEVIARQQISKALLETEDENMDNKTAEITKAAGVDDIGDVSDGYHTFNQLYHQRAMLFATIVNSNPDKAWKTHKHEDGKDCFGGGWFLVTIDTPEGSYGYHYEDKYWDYFKCQELEKAKHWDGYTEDDVTRLLSLNTKSVDVKAESFCSIK